MPAYDNVTIRAHWQDRGVNRGTDEVTEKMRRMHDASDRANVAQDRMANTGSRVNSIFGRMGPILVGAVSVVAIRQAVLSSHFFPGHDDPKMVRAINALNENQMVYTKRGKPKENSVSAGRKFYDEICIRVERVFVRGEDGQPVPLPMDKGWKKKIPTHVKVSAAAVFLSRRGELNTGN